MSTYKNFKTWLEEQRVEYPKTKTINASWFDGHQLPMIVHCTCCESTLALPFAYLDEDDYIYCRECAGIEE